MIKDNQPIHNIGFGVTSRDAEGEKGGPLQGQSPHSSFISRALGDHPMLAMTTAMVATGVAAGVAGKFVREGGLKLGYKLTQAAKQEGSSTFIQKANSSLLKMRRTLDELEGFKRIGRGVEELVYEDGGRLTTGYNASGLLDRDNVQSLRRGFDYAARDGKEWMWRDQFQQSLVKQARRLPYEVPAFYVADKAINKRLLGHESDLDRDSQDHHWYNPVPLLTTFAKDIAKTTLMQMGGFMIPAAMGSAAGKGSMNFYHNASQNLSELKGAKKLAGESIFFTQGMLQKVGHDLFDVLQKGINVSQRSTGAMAAAWTAYSTAEANPVQTLWRNRHGANAGDAAAATSGKTLSKKERFDAIATTIFRGNNEALNSDSLSDSALLDLIPGYKAIKESVLEGRTKYRTIKDAQSLLDGTVTYNDLFRKGLYNEDSSRKYLSTTIQEIQSKANSPLTKVNDFFNDFANVSTKDGNVKINPSQKFYQAINRQVYKEELKNRLIQNHGVSEKTADSFVKSLRIDRDLTFKPAAGKGRDAFSEGYARKLGLRPDRERLISPENRFSIGKGSMSEGDFFGELISKFNQSKSGINQPLNITSDDLQGAIHTLDKDFFTSTDIKRRVSELGNKSWSNIYRNYESVKGDTVLRTDNLVRSKYLGPLDSTRRADLIRKALEITGNDTSPKSIREAAGKLRQYGVDVNRSEDLTAFLTQNKAMQRSEYSGILNFLGIKKLGLPEHLQRRTT